MDIGFIGLGHMGQAIAGRLLGGGHTLRVWNRSPEPVRKLQEQGARAVNSPEEAFKGDAVFSMLGDDQALQSVLLESGVLARASRESVRVHVNMATISVAFSDTLATRHQERGVGYIAAPVLGRPDVAAAGKLNILAAGPRSEIEHVQPLLDLIGQKTWHFGDKAARANVVKLAMNFMLAAAMESMGEAAALASGYGIQPAELLGVASRTLFPGPVFEGYGKLIAEERYEPAGFKAKLGFKDIRLALAAGESAMTAMPLGSLLRDRMLEALAHGHGEQEFGVVLGRAALRDAGR